MKPSKIAVIGIVATIAVAGVAAAVPGDAPADARASDAPADEQERADDERADDAADERPAANTSERGPVATDAAGERGPPSSLPEQVPDRVSEIHSLIDRFLGGGLSDLGDAVSDVAGNGNDGGDVENGDGQQA